MDLNNVFLMKEETIGGSYSMETRYPFLDFDFVQSFLSLDYKLKNECYKAPLVMYLEKNNYPYTLKKQGFSIHKKKKEESYFILRINNFNFSSILFYYLRIYENLKYFLR